MRAIRTTCVRFFQLNALISALALGGSAFAQRAPDAGQILQQTQPPVLQAPRPATEVTVQPPAERQTLPGGQQVTLAGVKLPGQSAFTEAQLLAVLGEVKGQSLNLAGLRGLAAKISAHYRANGYPFARALIPAQSFAAGVLTIQIVEGRYGQVQAQGELAAPAQNFLTPLQPGAVIESGMLERTTLILDDQPGIRTAPIIRPGQVVGTGDLIVNVRREPMFSGDVGLDNHGNRYTGAYRARANLQWDSPFIFGDQASARVFYSNQAMWLGSLGYNLPLGSSGLRGNIGYAHTDYELGKDFAKLRATGTAKVATLGVSYPIVRSQQDNLTLGATYQNKRLNDKQQTASTDERKSSNSLPVALNFDRRDGLWGGGVTYGSLGYSAGRLKLDSMLAITDSTSGHNTRGSFAKWNLDIARVQAIPVAGLVLFGRVSSQWTDKNLDSSEGFSLGGANGVRAYPSGEGNGDEGWLVQLELRYSMGLYSPYLFHDSGRTTLNAKNGQLITPANPNQRSIGGEGFGLRYTRSDWNMDANLSWRSRGGKPESDTQDRSPRLWLAAGYRF